MPEGAHLGPEGDGVVLVGEPPPAGLHALAVDGLVDKARVELQRLLGGAVHGPELRADDAIQRVRQLLKAPVCQIPDHGTSASQFWATPDLGDGKSCKVQNCVILRLTSLT